MDALDSGDADADERDHEGRTALMWVSSHREGTVAGASRQETTYLRAKAVAVARILLSYGADAMDDYGMTSLHWAAASGQAEVVRDLLRTAATTCGRSKHLSVGLVIYGGNELKEASATHRDGTQ